MPDHDPADGYAIAHVLAQERNPSLHETALRQALPIYYGLLLAILTGCGILVLW